MRAMLIAILLLVPRCGSAPLFAQTANQSKPNDEVASSLADMERQWAEVCATHDTSVLERILADDFVGTNTEGKHYTKSEDIEKIRRSTKKYKSGRLDDVKVRFYGSNIAVLHGVETCVRETNDGKEEPETAVWTDTWIERNGVWQIVAAQDAIYQTSTQSSSETQRAASAAVDRTSEVVFVPAKQLLSEIRKAPEPRPSISWVDYFDTPPYTASVIRRTAPDRSEVHKDVTEVQFVIEGSGNLVTGGSLLEAVETESGELRGRGIIGGKERSVALGDLIVIPAGTPHWIRKIEGKDIVYLSVKSTSGKGGLPNDAAIATYGPQSPNSRPAAHSDANSVSGQVIAAEDRYTQAYLHRDWAAASALLAPDYYGNAEGFEGDRSRLEQEFPKIHLLQYEVVSTPHLKLLAPDVVLYNDVAAMRETYGDHDISGRYWHGDIWVRRDGRWVLLVEQEVWLREPATATAEAELRATMEQCRRASLEGDTEKVASCLAEEYRQTDISGYVQDKTTWLNEYFKPLAELITAGKFRWEVYERKDVQVRMYGDCAVVIGALDLKASGARPGQHTWVADPNASFSGTLRFTHVYVKRNGKWLLAALHNQLPPPPPPAHS
jgi:mannose-6-phosphate isomerase-like protein (cupin superfamily)